jgi:hypothetical protein
MPRVDGVGRLTGSDTAMPLMRLIYVSRPHAERMGSDFLAACDDILLASRRNNDRDTITGALVAAPRCFAQVLEGRRAAVSETFARICRDPRHERVEIVEARPIEQRRFGAWTMAFCDLAGVPEDLARRFRHGRDLDLATLAPGALLAFLEEASRAQADDNAILGAPRPRIDMAEEIVFRAAAE